MHNCVEIYDNSADWVTHSSIQPSPENTDTWRDRWGKPVTIDEMGYEGDVEWGVGNLTPQEMVRRCWEGVVRGGYVRICHARGVLPGRRRRPVAGEGRHPQGRKHT
ncbi:hypothetical protein [Streptomyces ipomoeae]|uniref:hypothetical protein n=1 Tax=Streptomyces ipomoeae TaxID=103232 RepID=UPI0015F11803|nr:hypothetical protein [Streptomyces ipomoeae]